MDRQFRQVQAHQRRLLAKSDRTTKLALFWEMRLGKSLATLRWLERKDLRSVLIVSPATVIPSWIRELQLERIPHRNLRTHPLPDYSSTLDAPRQYCCVNYELLRVRQHWLANEWDAIVLDESPSIRNPQAKVSKVLASHTTYHIPHRAILSGEPAPETLLDYFQQFKFLHGSFMGYKNYWEWRDYTHETTYSNYEWLPKKGMRAKILKEVKRLSFRLTRHQAGIGSEVVYQTRYTDLPTKARKAYRKAIKDFSYGNEETKYRIVVDNWLAQISGGEHKDRELLSLLQGELSNQPVVVWFRFNSELYRIKRKLDDLGIRSDYITGDVAHKRRQPIIDTLGGKTRVLLMQLKCGKYGLDLSKADTAIYFSCSYEADTRTQSVPRLIHPQKKTPVLILDLVTEDTIDQDIREALMKKGASSKSVLVQSFKKALNRELVG